MLKRTNLSHVLWATARKLFPQDVEIFGDTVGRQSHLLLSRYFCNAFLYFTQYLWLLYFFLVAEHTQKNLNLHLISQSNHLFPHYFP